MWLEASVALALNDEHVCDFEKNGRRLRKVSLSAIEWTKMLSHPLYAQKAALFMKGNTTSCTLLSSPSNTPKAPTRAKLGIEYCKLDTR